MTQKQREEVAGVKAGSGGLGRAHGGALLMQKVQALQRQAARQTLRSDKAEDTRTQRHLTNSTQTLREGPFLL
jgi:hypothetical protein